MRTLFVIYLMLAALGGMTAALPLPGSPERLVDWRWLARSPEGRRVTQVSKDPLEAYAGKYLLLEVNQPGVLDQLILNDPTATLIITVDNKPFWQGTVNTLVNPPTDGTTLLPPPIVCAGAGMYHLLAPIGFRTSLRILTDKGTLWRYLSYRMFRDPAAVLPADATSNGVYAQGLRAAATDWKVSPANFHSAALPPAREVSGKFTVGAGASTTALDVPGGGEITHLEFQVVPPLTGSLRELVVELFYDGANEPSLRVPLTDLVGMPHPWTNGRWDMLSGTLAGGIRYPTHAENYTVRLEYVLYFFNLPIPFATGLRLDLVNRSTRLAFSGTVRAVVAPAPEGRGVGRLCGTRVIAPIGGDAAVPLITLPGPGQLAGLGLFCTGNDYSAPAAGNGASWLTLDGVPPVKSPAIVPLWLSGAGSSLPIWNHPRWESQYVGAMRYFLTDPLPFEREATFGYDPGSDRTGAPTNATVIALWYRFGDTPYVAPPLPAHAEALPYVTRGIPSPVKGAQVATAVEAEDLVPLATAHGGEVLAVADADHNYHASGGKYLTIRVDALNDYTDLVLPFPTSRYFAIGSVCLTGPVNGRYDVNFELAPLSRQAALLPPSVPSTGANTTYSVLGGVPMNYPVFILGTLGYRRDSGDYCGPVLNPAPDSDGVLRYICRGPGATMLRFDQFCLFTPPPTAEGWQEFEDGPLPDCAGDMIAMLPRTGRYDWSGWGAVTLTATRAGTATVTGLRSTGPAHPNTVRLTGSLPPDDGSWTVTVHGSTSPAFTLTPGKDANQVMSWTIPIAGLEFPGPISLTITHTPTSAAKQETLSLDAWTVQ